MTHEIEAQYAHALSPTQLTALVIDVMAETGKARESIRNENQTLVAAAVEAATAEARSNLKRDMGMIAEASDGLEPIMSIETISGEDLDHKMEVVLGEACKVMIGRVKSVLVPADVEQQVGLLGDLKDELRIGVRTIWEAAVAERERLEVKAQGSLETETIESCIAHGKERVNEASGSGDALPMASAKAQGHVDTIREDVLTMVRDALDHTLSEERVEAAVVTVETTLDNDCFVPFIEGNAAMLEDAKAAAVAAVAGSFKAKVEAALGGKPFPVPKSSLDGACDQADTELLGDLRGRVKAFTKVAELKALLAEVTAKTNVIRSELAAENEKAS